MERRTFFMTCGISTAFVLLANSSRGNEPSDCKRNSGIKPIAGSWFEFEHTSIAEGKYWNPALRKFTDEQWKAKVKEIKEAGMEYLVLMSVAYDGKTYYPSGLAPRHDFTSSDPLDAVLSAADECGIKFFVSNDFWGNWADSGGMMTDPSIARLREKGMEETAQKYGHHKSFYGWYFPNESGLFNTIDETTMNYVNKCSKIARKLVPHSVNLIAPYGTKSVRADDRYVKALEKLDIDIMAYQDEIGVKKTKAGTAGKYYEALYKAHMKAGRARLWADMEIFEFETDVYKSALLPANFDRVLKQMEDISPFVEHILIYQYMGLMNKPGSPASAGHPGADRLYSDYMDWLNAQK